MLYCILAAGAPISERAGRGGGDGPGPDPERVRPAPLDPGSAERTPTFLLFVRLQPYSTCSVTITR